MASEIVANTEKQAIPAGHLAPDRGIYVEYPNLFIACVACMTFTLGRIEISQESEPNEQWRLALRQEAP